MTKEELLSLKSKTINSKILACVKKNWDGISKPLDGLGDFEKLIAQILAINESSEISVLKKALVVMCADHGVVAEGVSQCGQEVTLQVARLLGENRSTASTMAVFAKADCIPVDVGINSDEVIKGVLNKKVRYGTANFLVEVAMNEGELIEAIEIGIDLAKQCKKEGYHLLAAGEMGIGNTTSCTAMICALTGIELDKILGRGAGLSDEGLIRKRNVIEQSLKIHNLDKPLKSSEYTIRAMYSVGGLELAAMTGLFIGGAVYGLPVMIDGVLSATSALCAARLMPACISYMIPSHAGREMGTEYVLNILGLKPLVNGDMALGEGTGALMTMPLIDMALDFYLNATTFKQGMIKQYERMDDK